MLPLFFRNFSGSTCTRIAVCAALTLACAPLASAQPSDDQTAPAHVASIDGDVMLQREFSEEPAIPGSPIVAGDQLRTVLGRAEILFPDGTALDADEHTTVELQGPSLIRVTSGRVILTVARFSSGPAPQYRIDTPAGSAELAGPGEYRVAVFGTPETPQVEAAVVRGRAALSNNAGSVVLRAGDRSTAWADRAPAPPQLFNSAVFDPFDRWAAAQRDSRVGGGTSAQYLPPDLRMYGGALDQNGSWDYDTSYGYVWYPTVASGWMPYYYGYWSSVPRYGWTWVGRDRWAWPTHHYGRWGHANRGWFWIPGRQWGPGWVAWGAAPGYVGWSPLGYNNASLFTFSAGFSTSWGGGWVVVPRQHFGVYGRYADRYVVAPRALPPHTPFVTQRQAPIPPPRQSVLRTGGDRAVAVPRDRPRTDLPNADRRQTAPTGGAITSGSVVGRARPRSPESVPPASTVQRGSPLASAPGGVPNSVTRQPGRRVPGGGDASLTPPRDEGPSRTPAARRYPFGDFRGPRPDATPPAMAVPRGGQTAGSIAPRASAPATASAPQGQEDDRARAGSPGGSGGWRSARESEPSGGSVRRSPNRAPGSGSADAGSADGRSADGGSAQRGGARAVPRGGGTESRGSQGSAGAASGGSRSSGGSVRGR